MVLDWIRAIKDWVEAFADKPFALPVLFILAFVESSFFPIPPDVLLIALAVSLPKRSFWYAGVCTVGSVLGAFLGYYIGSVFFDGVAQPILEFYHVTDKFQLVLDKYRENAFGSIAIAGFTPIPYKVFTIAAGFKNTVDLGTLVAASIIGRGGRFFLVGGLFYFFGPKVKVYIDRYFDVLAVAFVVLLVLGFFAIRFAL